MKKADRQRVFEKYGGKCAYTGKPLEDDWQVDHKYCKLETTAMQMERNHPDNLLPALKIINHYKRGLLFESWRARIMKLHIRLSKLPKKTRTYKTAKTKSYILEVAEAFGITSKKPFGGKFYFETVTTNPDKKQTNDTAGIN